MAAKEVFFFSEFSYRKNTDGTYDSICLTCFQTVATAKSIEELAGREFLHTLECYKRKPPASDRLHR